MKNTPRAASKASWGREAEKTIAMLTTEAEQFFEAVKTPPEWRFLKFDRAEAAGVIYSIGAVFVDTRTRGFDVKRYRVFICSTSGKGGICEIAVNKSDGKYSLSCLIWNKTADVINEYIRSRFNRLERAPRWWRLPAKIKRKRYDRIAIYRSGG